MKQTKNVQSGELSTKISIKQSMRQARKKRRKVNELLVNDKMK